MAGGGEDGNREYYGIEHGGDGGGLRGYQYNECGVGGSQTSGFAFGRGQGATDGGLSARYGGPGAGGGWYGGYHSTHQGWEGGGGGSGYVWSEATASSVPTGYSVDTAYYLTDAETIAGNQSIPTYDGQNIMTGNRGNGYAKITLLEQPSGDNLLKELQISYAGNEHTIVGINPNDAESVAAGDGDVDNVLEGDFTYGIDNYSIKGLGSEDTEVTIYGVQRDIKATVEGNGTYVIPASTESNPHQITIKVTAESGDYREYVLNVVRPASTNAKLMNIKIDGLIDSLISVNREKYGVLKNTLTGMETEFNPDIYEYSMTIPASIKELTFNVTKGHPFQTVTGDGKVSLLQTDNDVVITVVPEDGSVENTKTYTYHIRRDPDSNTLLSSLHVTNLKTSNYPSLTEDMDIDFNQTTLEYYLIVPNEVDRLDIEAIPDSDRSTVDIRGGQSLRVGANTVYIIVDSPNKDQLVYIIHCYRMQNGNTFLGSLKVKIPDGSKEYSLNPVYNKTIDTYDVEEVVPNEISAVNIEAIPEVPTTTVTGAGLVNLQTGVNIITVELKAQNNDIGTYTITINRAKSNNNYLSSLTTAEGNFIDENTLDESGNPVNKVFTKEDLNYAIEVGADVDRLNLSYTKEVETSTVRITGNSAFKAGKNEVRITVTAENGETRDYIITVNKAQSANCYLKSLSLDGGELTPAFYKETVNYTVEVENEVNSINIMAETEDSRSTLEGNGTYALAIGDNNISIVVTAEDGTQKTYHVNIIRKRNSNKNLLKVEGKYQVLGVQDDDPNFIEKETITSTATKSNDGITYVINVPNETDSIDITGYPERETSTVSGNGKQNLVVGENRFTLVVTSADETTKEYTVVVNRAKSNNCNLKYLFINESNYAPKLTADKTEYDTTVLSGTTSLTMDIVPEDDGATYVVEGNENFVEGENDVRIIVTASDGVTKKTYTLRVFVQTNNVESNYLTSLVVDPGIMEPDFDKDQLVYQVELPYEDEVAEVTAIAESSAATVEGTGTYNLTVGENDVAVVVTSGDGIKRTYQIKITRAQSKEARLSSLEVDGHVLSPVFDKDVDTYYVDTTLEGLNISAETLDIHATYEIIGNNNFVKGTNNVIVRVTAPDGVTQKDYTIIVTKTASPNFYLSNLQVVGYTISPEFNKTTASYVSSVPSTTYKVEVRATPEDVNSTVSINGVEGQSSVISLNSGKNVVRVIVISESGKAKTYTVTINKGLSDDNHLKHLSVSNGTLDPAFDKDVLTYTVSVPYEIGSEDIIAYANDYRAQVTGQGNFVLNVGNNRLEVKVTSESGLTRTYVINVNRGTAVSSDLEYLIVKNYKLSPKFVPNTKNYSTSVDYEIATVKDLGLIIRPLDPAATYVIKLGDKVVTEASEDELIVGVNNISIEVTSSDGAKTSTYNLNVTRKPESNNFLTYIEPSVGELNPSFSKTTINYTIEVESDVNSISFSAVPEAEDSVVEGINENYSLNKGENEFVITVTSAMGIKRYYTITVNRKLSSNNYLSSLKVRKGTNEVEYKPIFNKETLAYIVDGIPAGTTVIQLQTVAEDSLATVSGDGYIYLTSATTTQQIVVTAEDGKTRTYTVTINRDKSTEAHLIDLTPSVGVLSPAFSYDSETNTYDLVLGNTDEFLSFDVRTQDKNATVTGHEEMEVPNGESTRIITVTAEDGVTKITYTIHVNRIRTDDARLQALTLADGLTLEPEFNENTYSYTIYVPNDVTKFEASSIASAIPKYLDSVVTLDGDIQLSTKKANIFKIHVLAPDKFTTQDYRLNIIRAKNADNYLASLSVDVTDIIELYEGVSVDYNSYTNMALTPVFNKETLNYTLTVPEGTNKVNIKANAENEEATISGIGEKDIRAGNNVFEITVNAENGNTRVYKLTIVRPVNSNNYLSSLKPMVAEVQNKGKDDEQKLEAVEYSLDPVFDKETDTYTVYADNEDYYVYFEATPESSLSNVSGLEETFIEDGENTRTIIVTAEDLTTKTYTVNIVKNRTNRARLSSLAVKNYSIDQEFDPEVYEYTLTVPNDKFELTANELEAVAMYEESTITYTGIKRLLTTEVNVYEVTVVSPDGSETKVYRINITRQKSSDSSLRTLVAAGYRLSPEFTSDNTNYICYVPKGLEKFEASKVSYEPTNEAATVSVDPDVTIVKDRDVYYNLYVTSEDETSNTTYSLKIEYEKSGNGNLQSLEAEGGTIVEEFKPEDKTYTVRMSNRADSLTIDAVPEDSNAAITQGIGTFTIDELIEGSVSVIDDGNTKKIQHMIIVQAENGNHTIYTLNIVKDMTPLTVITGKVITENSNNIHKSQVALYRAGARVGVDEPLQTIETSNDGTYTFDVADATIGYDIYITKQSYLDLKLKNIGVTEGSTTTLADVQLVAGNLVKYTDISYGLDEVNDSARIAELKELYCTDDLTLVMQIEIDDIVLLNDNLVGDLTDSNRALYGKYDLNEDGRVDEEDRAIIKNNYGCAYEEIDCT